MNNVLLASATRDAVNDYLSNPSPVLMLTGTKGSGKRHLALNIVSELVGVDYDRISSYPYLVEISPTKNSISIEAVRELQKDLVRTVPGTGKVRRVVIIDEAHTLGLEAQNALLKILEETKEGTVFILCIPKNNDVLETVTSRSREIRVQSVSEIDASAYFQNSYSKQEIEHAYKLSQGSIGLMNSLLEGEKTDLTDSISDVKRILALKQYDKLIEVLKLSKDKESVTSFLEAFSLLAHASAKITMKAGKNTEAKQWQAISKQVIRAQKSLKYNANSKLVLTDLFLNI